MKDETDTTRTTEEYIKNYERQTKHHIEVINPETVEGETFTRAYDVTLYPTLLVVASDGQMQASWRGVEELPLFDEIEAYLFA
jgi:hypothetical protein